MRAMAKLKKSSSRSSRAAKSSKMKKRKGLTAPHPVQRGGVARIGQIQLGPVQVRGRLASQEIGQQISQGRQTSFIYRIAG
jgi:hypothetical protein